MLRSKLRFPVVVLLAALALSRVAQAEPIQVPASFIALWKPFPADWTPQRITVTVASPATGGKGARVRVEKSSGDARADKIAVDYISHVLNLKPNLRAKNAGSQLVFPVIVDATAGASHSGGYKSEPGDTVYQAGLPGYDISRPDWPKNATDFTTGGRLVIRVVFGRDGKVEKVSLLKSSGSAFLDAFAVRWALSHWRCAQDKTGSAMVVPIVSRIGSPGNQRDGHQPFNREVRGREPSYGRSGNP